MSTWQPIETAPKDKYLLLFGMQRDHELLRQSGPVCFVGYWDEIDTAWCSIGSTWEGPFYDPTHWQPLPEPPVVTNLKSDDPREAIPSDSAFDGENAA